MTPVEWEVILMTPVEWEVLEHQLLQVEVHIPMTPVEVEVLIVVQYVNKKVSIKLRLFF